MAFSYPDLIQNLPEIDIPIAGVVGKLLQGKGQQAVFFDIDPSAVVPAHKHSAQFGFMIDGEMDLTIGGETRRVKTGDSYFIPAGTTHSAKFLRRSFVMDLFDEPGRYREMT